VHECSLAGCRRSGRDRSSDALQVRADNVSSTGAHRAPTKDTDVKTSRILLTLTTGLVLATPLASFADTATTPAPAATTAPAAKADGTVHHKHHHRHHAAKDGDQKSGDAAAKPTTK
jgi:hypothetical protein